MFFNNFLVAQHKDEFEETKHIRKKLLYLIKHDPVTSQVHFFSKTSAEIRPHSPPSPLLSRSAKNEMTLNATKFHPSRDAFSVLSEGWSLVLPRPSSPAPNLTRRHVNIRSLHDLAIAFRQYKPAEIYSVVDLTTCTESSAQD